MSKRLQTMKELAANEVKKLKKLLTPTEKESLNIDEFDPTSKLHCIYGMATGNCNTKRAQKLIKKCCQRVYVSSKKKAYEPSGERRLNGKPCEVDTVDRDLHYFSPLEILIYQPKIGEEIGEKIIAYLKDETKTLTL